MRAVAAVVLPFLLLLLAGCSEDQSEVPDPSVVPTPTTSTGPDTTVAAPTIEILPFSFDGNLGTSAHGCVFPAGTCHTQDVVAGSTDLLVERPGANLTALSFDVTWTAQTPATQTLATGSMVMVSCEGCNGTQFGEVSGTSPLHVEVTDVSVPLHADARIHIYVYNPQGFVYDPAVPAYGFISVDQPFHIEGTATLSVPAS
jgi:hypothetical protein